jgi:hypothetical protein
MHEKMMLRERKKDDLAKQDEEEVLEQERQVIQDCIQDCVWRFILYIGLRPIYTCSSALIYWKLMQAELDAEDSEAVRKRVEGWCSAEQIVDNRC